jgi:5-methylcytosine-specific restriction endonuclease McrA
MKWTKEYRHAYNARRWAEQKELQGPKNNQRNRDRYHRLRSEFIESQGSRCAICHGTENLEIDHVDPTTKKHRVCNLWNRREEVRTAELAKCQVICNQCHKDKTLTGHDKREGKKRKGD